MIRKEQRERIVNMSFDNPFFFTDQTVQFEQNFDSFIYDD
jgi:hypothetical protein